jgi:hypothetical protein
MSLNKQIAESIDVHLMDTKNVASIIEGYCKHQTYDNKDFNKIEFEYFDPQSDDNYAEYTFLISDKNDIYIEVNEWGSFGDFIYFKDNKTYSYNTLKKKERYAEYLDKNPSKYILIATGGEHFDEHKLYKCWRIDEIFSDKLSLWRYFSKKCKEMHIQWTMYDLLREDEKEEEHYLVGINLNKRSLPVNTFKYHYDKFMDIMCEYINE